MAVASIVLTEMISNAATVAILLPIGYSLGAMSGVDPLAMTLAVTIPAGLAFMLPISSPPNAISYSAGHYGVKQVVTLGWRMNGCRAGCGTVGNVAVVAAAGAGHLGRGVRCTT